MVPSDPGITEQYITLKLSPYSYATDVTIPMSKYEYKIGNEDIYIRVCDVLVYVIS